MKKITGIILALLMTALMFTGCSDNTESGRNNASVNAVVDFHSEKQEKYLDSEYSQISKFAKGKKDISQPEPVLLSWPEDNEHSDYVVCISESEDMKAPITYAVDEPCLNAYNLKTDTEYYWTYTVGDDVSEVFSFKTSDDAPRNLYVDGVKNVRDLGGWNTENGKKIKQGLIFRCGRLNKSSSETPVIEITEIGIDTMKNQLEVKTEIDLRKADGETGAITQSPLGDGVRYCSCPMVWEGDIFTANKEEILNVFAILSDENNYPVIFHCNIGTDRTGMIAFLINALCGVGVDDLKRDYLFSNFSDINGPRNVSDLEESGYYKAVGEAEGDSLSEKTYNCLSSFGVPKEQLDSVIRIMTEA